MSVELVGEALDHGSEEQGGDEGEEGDDQDDRDSTTPNVGVSVRSVPRPAGLTRLPASEPATASTASSGQEAAAEHREAAEHVGERDAERAGVGAVRLEEARVAGERRAVVVALRRVGVERLGEALRAAVVDRRRAPLRADRERGGHEHHHRHGDRAEDRQLDLARLDLLAEELRRAPDHQAGDEDAEDDEQQHRVQARADAAPDDLAGHHLRHRDRAAEAAERLHRGVDGAARGGGRDRGEERARADAEALLLALQVVAGQAGGVHRRGRAGLADVDHRDRDDEQRHHRAEDHPALAPVADHTAVHRGQAGRDDAGWRASRRSSRATSGSRTASPS